MIGRQCLRHRLRQHLSKVQNVAFSCDSNYLSSLGGQDDNALVVWDIETGEAICGAAAASESALACKWVNGRNDRIVTSGYYHVRVWQVDFRQPKLYPMDCKLGTLRRVFQCMDITDDDHFAYLGTTTGDLVKIKIDRDEVRPYNEPDTIIPTSVAITKDRLSLGMKVVKCIRNPSTGNVNIIVGAGDGTITYVNPSLNFVKGKKLELMGGITSISLHPTNNSLIVGTDQCNRYDVTMDLADAEMKTSCHFGSVNDVVFPAFCPDLIVTSSAGDIRVWNIRINQELLRIQVPNLECLCSIVTPTGSALISGWDDGKIRAFYPETGRIKFVIPDAHTEKVTALAVIDDDNRNPYRIISGGHEGRVRIWNVSSSHQTLLSSLKEHRGAVNCLRVTNDRTQCISASSDGSCIVWDLQRYVRILAFFEPNVFESVLYHPDESQMLTCGSNHKITYWDASDGQAIRVLEGGDGAMKALDVEPSGEFFVSGGEDKILKVWHYDEGLPVAVGHGHSGIIKSLKISPDQRTIVSVGSTGEIIFWEMPSLEALRSNIDVDPESLERK
jgi:WD40 repeat protein